MQEIRIPQGEISMALLSFNLGVEVGQIAFVVVVMALALVLKRVSPAVLAVLNTAGATGARTMAYAIGGVSAYWFLDRLSGFI
ncbi:HupE/UreJ family protein [Pseudohalocynthiibacter aestuariivivens]|uniref:HupE/UreJ family protein n=1 Tax=Pseudohalocynthiibacter aestuariivivens TaxID=1591409 RepID=A0ABV5JBN5_9RHOB|nr:HupE/UreJ family protein [Pseudohalocynthiibacter aestuariivivens]